MTRALFLVTALLFTLRAGAEEINIEPTQNPSAPHRLFKTRNIYTFLKLDTRTGLIWQLQWGLENRFTVPLNAKALIPGGKAGRFTLYPTQNIYTFVLLDQDTGNTWQVQWGDEDHRFVVPIE